MKGVVLMLILKCVAEEIDPTVAVGVQIKLPPIQISFNPIRMRVIASSIDEFTEKFTEKHNKIFLGFMRNQFFINPGVPVHIWEQLKDLISFEHRAMFNLIINRDTTLDEVERLNKDLTHIPLIIIQNLPFISRSELAEMLKTSITELNEYLITM